MFQIFKSCNNLNQNMDSGIIQSFILRIFSIFMDVNIIKNYTY